MSRAGVKAVRGRERRRVIKAVEPDFAAWERGVRPRLSAMRRVERGMEERRILSMERRREARGSVSGVWQERWRAVSPARLRVVPLDSWPDWRR